MSDFHIARHPWPLVAALLLMALPNVLVGVMITVSQARKLISISIPGESIIDDFALN